MEKPSPLLVVLFLSSLVGNSREDFKCENEFEMLITYRCNGGKNRPITKEMVTSALSSNLRPGHKIDEIEEL